MPANDDLKVIRELLTGEPPSPDVNDYVKGRLSAVITAAECAPAGGRPGRRNARPHRTAAEAARRRRRRLALSSAAAVGALAAGAVALVAVVVPGTREGGADTTGYVVKRVSSAISAAEPGEIAQMTVTTRTAQTPGGAVTTTTAEEWSNGGQWRLVTYSPERQPLYDEGFSTPPRYTLVNYQARTWARQPGLGRPAVTLPLIPGQGGCQPAPAAATPLLFGYGLPGTGPVASSRAGAISLPSTVARDLRTAVSCGALVDAGRQRVDGTEAIELTSHRGSPISETIWVSQSTYLPVRVVVRLSFGKLPGREQTADFTWLPPTAQNLARLTVPIPAGFRRVPVASAVNPILQPFPGGPLQPKTWPNKVICQGPDGPTCKGYPGGNS
jgi:hypothetical protein